MPDDVKHRSVSKVKMASINKIISGGNVLGKFPINPFQANFFFNYIEKMDNLIFIQFLQKIVMKCLNKHHIFFWN